MDWEQLETRWNHEIFNTATKINVNMVCLLKIILTHSPRDEISYSDKAGLLFNVSKEFK